MLVGSAKMREGLGIGYWWYQDLIHRTGPKATAIWRLGAGQPSGQS